MKKHKNITYNLFLLVLFLAAVVYSCDSYVFFVGGDGLYDMIRLGAGVFLAPMVWLFSDSVVDQKSVSASKVGFCAAVVLLFYACLGFVFVLDKPSGIPTSSLSTISIYLIKACLVLEICGLIYLVVKSLNKADEIRKNIILSLVAVSALSLVRIFYPIDAVGAVAVISILNVLLTVVIAFTSSKVLRVLVNVKEEIEVKEPSVVSSIKKKLYVSLSSEESRNPEEVSGEEESDSEKKAEEAAAQQTEEDLQGLASEQGLPQLSEADENSLRHKFENYIIASQKFLTPGLTMGDIAKALDTNRTYISQLVNQTYGMTFPEFLNNLRIDYAEQYILHNREASQQEIAHACGFPSASSFNVTFKKITGVTPKIWLATYSGK
ncbi:MAG: helix-turn-helix domain-containing protein [Bacteroidales bacterium]|nr:helix-turn-helix domain-containing protein [Bacteroidales bacterium]